MNNRSVLFVVGLVGLLAVLGMFAGSDEPIPSFLENSPIADWLFALHIGNSIVFSVSTGVFVSILIWIALVYVPERNQRSIIRRSLSEAYRNFKEDTIQILLWASIGTHDSELPTKLSDYQQFKEFFGDDKWYDVLNGIQDNDSYRNDLLVEMELLQQEVAHVLDKVRFDDEEVYTFFKRLSTNVYKLRNSTIYTGDHAKYLGQFLWETLAQWSFIDGQREEDPIALMIKRL